MSSSKSAVTLGDIKTEASANQMLTLQPAPFLSRLILPVLNLFRSIRIQRRERLMRLCETLPLGEKRFLAIVQVDRQRLLLAASNQSISLLCRLGGPEHPDPLPSTGSSGSSQDRSC